MARIYGQQVDIDRDAVRAFFEMRGKNINPDAPLTSTMYQDHAPEIAEARDRFEKQEIVPLLRLRAEDRVLDIGCGIGRWADAVAPKVSHIHGVDFSESLIAAATKRLTATPNATFQQLAAEAVAPRALTVAPPYSRIIISGLLIYLNEREAMQTLQGALACAADEFLIYIREPVALEKRLTLDHIYSAELKNEYNAVYRTLAELRAMLDATLGAARVRFTTDRPLLPDALSNRSETAQHVLIGERP